MLTFSLHRVINILESVLSLGSERRLGGLKVDSLDRRLTNVNWAFFLAVCGFLRDWPTLGSNNSPSFLEKQSLASWECWHSTIVCWKWGFPLFWKNALPICKFQFEIYKSPSSFFFCQFCGAFQWCLSGFLGTRGNVALLFMKWGLLAAQWVC